MGRTSVRAAAVIALTALFTGSATASFAATSPQEVNPPIPVESPTGTYIVLLDEDPAATYDGGEPGLAPTKPEDGEKLDAQSTAVEEYSAFLQERQQDVAADAGVQATATYQVALNGFSAAMTPEQAGKLAVSRGVLGVFPDEIRHLTAESSTRFLGLEGPGGVWDSVGGVGAAGEGVVVGVIDTGIAPDNPSFAGDPLGTAPGDEPYLDGNDVVYQKADGNEFRSTRVTGPEWSLDDYSTKIVGAQVFLEAAQANPDNDLSQEFLSPYDVDGHGSHTAGTAAGNNAIPASVQGVDFGDISGVAPAAKIAAYKACYSGPDPGTTDDDGCVFSDLLDAIDTAVSDGVDVINYSIGGGAATTTLGAEDIAFFNAAVAGVFVSASAGNAGPGDSTLDHASPWYTTVAASTIPTYEGTVQLPNGFQAVGTSVTVPFGESITAPVVYAGDAGLAGLPPATRADLCFLGSLDPVKVAGKIVVCDRGVNARVEKSQEVAAKGGVGMILVNVTPSSLDNDFHSVPTVHINAQFRAALLDYVRNTPGATATLIGDNVTGVETPTPQVAGFSSRGPALADGGDVLKPDISAPGVAILAPYANAPGSEPAFNFLSGTSMAAPHVAGLAALYLGVDPTATPDEIKSAMMTTADNTVNEDGSDNTDPFAQGAGQVDATQFLDPGVLYLNGPADWQAFIEGTGNFDFEDVEAVDPSDLNLASISIGTLSKEQTVTRTLTGTRPGTYTVSASVPGVNVTVSPSTLSFGAAGESQSFTVTFSNASAAVEQWSTGFLTWTGADGTVARSPLAVRPVTADAPAEVTGQGITGSTDVTIDSGISGQLALNVSGLAPVQLLADPANPVPGHSGNENSGDENGDVYWTVEVPEGATLARFSLDSSDDEGSDLDLFAYHLVDENTADEQYQSATGSADEELTLSDPTPGTWLVQVNLFAVTGPLTWDLTAAVVNPDQEGSLTASPNPLPVTQSAQATYTLSWTGLEPDTRYLGLVRYGDSSVQTILTVDAGPAAPVATAPPTISGTPKVGKTLTANPGTWDPADVTIAYQWLRDGVPIDGATAQTYRVAQADVGTTLSVRVTATAEGNVNPGVAESAGVFVKYSSSTKVTMNRYVGTSSQNYAVTVEVTPSAGPAATGTVNVWVNTRKYTATLTDGAATINLPRQSRGLYLVIAEYVGSETVQPSAGISAFVVLR